MTKQRRKMTDNKRIIPKENELLKNKSIVPPAENKNDASLEEGLCQIQQTSATFYHYRGPVPSPEQLMEYNKIDATFANRLLTMAEKTLEAENNQKNADAYYKRKQADAIKTGQMIIFSILTLLIAAGVVLAYYGKSWSAGGMAAFAAALCYLVWKPQKTKKSEKE